MVLELSCLETHQRRQISCSIPRSHAWVEFKTNHRGWDGAHHGGTKNSPALGHRRTKSWCISGMPRTWQQQLHLRQPNACNPHPTRVEGYARPSRAASRQGITNTPTAVAFSRVTGKRAQERRLQLKNSGGRRLRRGSLIQFTIWHW